MTSFRMEQAQILVPDEKAFRARIAKDLYSPDWRVRVGAIRSLERLEDAQTLVSQLTNRSRPVAQEVREALLRMGPRSLDALFAGLSDSSSRIRTASQVMLERLCPVVSLWAVRPKLLEVSSSDDSRVRSFALKQLATLDSASAETWATLWKAAQGDRARGVRMTAQKLLSQLAERHIGAAAA